MNEQLDRLGKQYWDTLMESNPTWATIIGDHRFDDQIEDPSRAGEDELMGRLDTLVAEATAIDPATLDREDRITREVLLFEAGTQADALRSRDAEYAVDPAMGLHVALIQYVPQMTPNTQEHADAYLGKAEAVAGLFDALIERHREGVANGRTPPHISVERSLDQITAYLASPVESDPWLQIKPPEDSDDTTVADWRSAMQEQIETSIRPAYERYAAVVRDEVLPASRPQDKSGVGWLPDGEEVYDRAVKRYTSLDLDPREIHQIGLDVIAALEEEYVELGGPLLGTTNLSEIYDKLRHDESLRFETADQVKEQAERALARANEVSKDWFGRLPVAPCIVQPIPELGADEAPLAYYLPPAEDGSRPGVFFINVVDPTTRTRYESEALAFHESVPGHHFQLSVAQELEGVPAFRRNGLVTAYVEGWGLYTERLADEMGLYSGDVERMGMLSFDSWRAGRLVVDTGMHALGWSRQQAIGYLTENSPQAPNNIINEVDRYIGWPGQALAYKMGQREIFRARESAKKKMGDRFDIKGFHDTVLEAGPVPLPLLASLVDEWAGS